MFVNKVFVSITHAFVMKDTQELHVNLLNLQNQQAVTGFMVHYS